MMFRKMNSECFFLPCHRAKHIDEVLSDHLRSVRQQPDVWVVSYLIPIRTTYSTTGVHVRRSQSSLRGQSRHAHTFSVPYPSWYLALSNQELGLISRPYLALTSHLPFLDIHPRSFGDEGLIIA